MIYNLERPETLDCVEGQDDTLMPLKAQCRKGRFSHSYMMTGHYGCGKTTVSRIMARAANCENPTENGPCCMCSSCKLMQSGASMDYIELDAASNNGVEDIRQIVEQCKYLPVNLNYKIFIIDEVHMLSTGAFNALLKTLEEPPEHVIFFLCTTELHKVPKTIVSRCQIYEFRAIDSVTIASKLANLCDKYNYTYDMDGLYLIAKASNGAMRDALSIFEQCIVEKGVVDAEKVRKVIGLSDDVVSFSLLKSMAVNDICTAISLLQEQFDKGKNINFLLKNILEILSDVLLALREKSVEHIYNTADYKKLVSELADICQMELVFEYIEKFSEIRGKIQKDLSPEIYLQAEIIGMSMQKERKDELQFLKDEVARLKELVSTGSENEKMSTGDELSDTSEIISKENNQVPVSEKSTHSRISVDGNSKEFAKSVATLAGFDIGEDVDLGDSNNDGTVSTSEKQNISVSEELSIDCSNDEEKDLNSEFIVEEGFDFPSGW